MTQEQIKKARAIRRRRVRERQAVIFGTLAAILGVIALWAVAVYNDAIGLPFDPGFSYEEQAQDEVFPTACLPDKTLPLGAKKIAVNVYNASEKNGFAGIVANDLKKRGLNVKETGNAEAKRNTTAIIFGIDGIRAAYTLHAHVPSAALILDDTREGKTIDIHIGESFKSLLPSDSIELDSETPMVSLEGCQPLWELTNKVEPPESIDEDEPAQEQKDEAEKTESEGA